MIRHLTGWQEIGGLSRRDGEEYEAAVASLGVPYTIIRAGSLKDEEGGQLGFRYGQMKPHYPTGFRGFSSSILVTSAGDPSADA